MRWLVVGALLIAAAVIFRWITKSGQSRSERTVFSRYASKKSGEGTRAYSRHSAFQGQFQRYDGTWYLEIIPTHRFTADGVQVLRFDESKLKGIEALRDMLRFSVKLVMWADLLRGRTDDLFAPPAYSHIEFDELRIFLVKSGINESAWLATEGSENIKENVEESPGARPLSTDDSPYASNESAGTVVKIDGLDEPELEFGGGAAHRYSVRHHELWPARRRRAGASR